MVIRPTRAALLLGAIVLAGCADTGTPTQLSLTPAAAPRSTAYIVLLRDTVTDALAVTAEVMDRVDPTREVTLGAERAPGAGLMQARIPGELSDDTVDVLPSLHAALVTATDEEFVRLRRDPAVAVIEPVRDLTLTAATLQTTRSWGLDRVDQVALPLDGRLTRFGDEGKGVRIALFDTGIRWTHSELKGRVAGGYDAFTNAAKTSGDAHGHGTLTASLAAGSSFGTAPSATVLDVRVMDAKGTGTSLELVRGTDWVIAEKRRVAGPMVVNMSLGVAGGSTVVDALVDRLRAAGIVVVTAAGNAGGDACALSPARAPGAITVGATTATDARPSFSNGGSCVDLSAPGNSILGASMTGDAAQATGSGTSMSAPFVAGAAAVFLAVNPTASPDAAGSWILSESTTGRITGLLPNTPNRLLALRRLPSVLPPTPAPTPAATPKPAPPISPMSLVATCVARTCTIDAGVPTAVSAADAAGLLYTWNFQNVGTQSGIGARRFIVTFQSAGSLTVTVTAQMGSATVGTATTTMTVK